MSNFTNVSQSAIQAVLDCISNGDHATANNDEEQTVFRLMHDVNTVTSKVPGLAAAGVVMCNEIHGLMFDLGLPSFYIMINPANVYNPIVKFLSGSDFDLDDMLPEDVPNYWEQASLIASNPFIAANFFDSFICAFIEGILAFKNSMTITEPGILSVTKGYYGCVEAQG